MQMTCIGNYKHWNLKVFNHATLPLKVNVIKKYDLPFILESPLLLVCRNTGVSSLEIDQIKTNACKCSSSCFSTQPPKELP